MTSKIKALFEAKRQIESESQELHRKLNDGRHNPTEALVSRVAKIDRQLSMMSIWLNLLNEDEAFVIQRHLIDGVDLPRVAVEYAEKWGDDHAKTDRTLKTYQRKALAKIHKFVVAQQNLTGDDYDNAMML